VRNDLPGTLAKVPGSVLGPTLRIFLVQNTTFLKNKRVFLSRVDIILKATSLAGAWYVAYFQLVFTVGSSPLTIAVGYGTVTVTDCRVNRVAACGRRLVLDAGRT
jgi:hypothetical protein